MRVLPLNRCPRLVTPLHFHTVKLMGSLLILNTGLGLRGMRVEGDSLRLSILCPFHQAERVMFVVLHFK